MFANFSDGTLAPWLLGGLLLLVLLTSIMTVKAWRSAKLSPYFFMRRRAQEQMQSYLLATVALLALTFLTAAYANHRPEESRPRTALLTRLKPLPVVTIADDVDEPAEVVDVGSDSFGRDIFPVVGEASTGRSAPSFAPPAALLPAEFDQIEAEVELSDDTALTPLVFSQEVDANFRPMDARRLFSRGFFTIYATFEYEGLANGMAWSWVWRYDGEVVGGGNQKWEYGADGPGYVYLNPEEGFRPGTYSVEVWVNRELMSEGSVTVTTGAVSSSN